MNAGFKRRRARIGALTLVLAALFVLTAIRLVVLVLIDGPRLSSIARSEHMSTAELAAARGPIVDRSGQPLALSAESRSVYARTKSLLENSGAQERSRLAVVLGMKPRELEAKLQEPHAPWIWLAREIPREQARAAEDLGLAGVGVVNEYKRYYPESNLAASVVGEAGVDGQGLSGLELQYNKIVKGEPVELHFYHDAFGHPILDSPLELKNPEPGARLELTLDASIQSVAETYLTEQVSKSGAARGTAVVLDPFSGEVLALANAEAGGNHARARLHDTAVQDAFEPGSTIKGILGSIALADGAITPNQEIYCENGEFHFDGRTIHDDSRRGFMDLGGIIEVSSNIGAAKIALKLGAQRYYQGLSSFGIGRRTGIDLPGEGTGILRPPAWRDIELANHGFGQGVAVTPIQLANAYAAIANGGVLMRPFIVKAAYDADGNQILARTPQAVGRVVSPAVAHEMNLLLRGVVNGQDGTGRLARVGDFTVAGKTGTAQMVNPATGGYYQNRLVASFVGFLPADDPRLVILVVLYDVGHGHFGGLYAAPVFSEIASAALDRLDVAAPAPAYDTASLLPFGGGPDDGAEVAEVGGADAGGGGGDEAVAAAVPPAAAPDSDEVQLAPAGTAPDLAGMSLRAAMEVAEHRGFILNVRGSGYVVSQDPAADRPLDHGAVEIVLAPTADGSMLTPDAAPASAYAGQRRTSVGRDAIRKRGARAVHNRYARSGN